MKVCGKCGAQCMDNQIYCHSCGAALDEKKGAASKATDAVKDFGQDYKAYTDNYFGEKTIIETAWKSSIKLMVD